MACRVVRPGGVTATGELRDNLLRTLAGASRVVRTARLLPPAILNGESST